MEYPGSPTERLGSSVPNPTDLSRRLLSTQQAQNIAESSNDDEGATTPTPRSRVNSVTRFDISPGAPFWSSFSPAPRSPVLIQCCCRREDCQNLLAFLDSTRSMEGELRLSAEVGQALLQKHELYQKEIEHQCARSEQKVQDLDELIRDFEDTQRELIRERDDALRQKMILEEKNDTIVTTLDKKDSMLRDLNMELKACNNEIKRLTANNIKGEKSEEREEMLIRQLEDLRQELAVSRKSEISAEIKVKRLNSKYDVLYDAHEKLKKEQAKMQKSKHKLEAVAMLRESNERLKESCKSSPPNDEANNHLIALIKELSSANNKLKSEISEYRELLSESRNEVSTLQYRVEDMETASTAGYVYPASYTSSVAFASPFKPNFPLHVLDEMGMGGENSPNVNVEVEESGEGSTIPSRSAAKPIHPHMSPISSSFGPASHNTFNSLGVDPSMHSPAGSLVSTSALSSSNPLHHHHHHYYYHYPNENDNIVRGSVFGELEKYIMEKKHKRPGRNSIRKGKKVFAEIGEEDEEKHDDAQSDITGKKHERNENENSDSNITYSDDSDEERNPEGDEKAPKREKSRSKFTKSQEKKKIRAFSSPDQNTSQNVSLLSASLKRSAAENSKDELKGEKPLPKKTLSAIKKKDYSKSSHNRAPSAPAPLNLPSKQKQHKPSQPSPLSVNRQTTSATSQPFFVKGAQSSNSPAINSKSKAIPAFKNPKFATLGPKERKQMMEAWRNDVANEQLNNGDDSNYEQNKEKNKIVKGKSQMGSTNSPVKEFVEEVLIDEANFSVAEAAVLANEVEHSLTTSAKSTNSHHTPAATRHVSHHVPSITVQGPNESYDFKATESSQQNPYQLLFNIGCSIMERLKGTDLLALNRRLKRTFDILELTNLSNNLIENILADVENLRERFRWVEDLCKNEGMKTDEKEAPRVSPENFLPLTHLMQDLLTEICKLRVMINEVQVEYFQKVEASRRKAEEEFDRSLLNGKDDEIMERREKRRSQSSDNGIGAYFSRVFGGVKEIQSSPTSARHHSRRLSVDFSHDRDVSVGSIDTFAEDSYFADRNLETYTSSTSNALRGSGRRDSNETVGSMIKRNVVSFFGGGGGGNNIILKKKHVAEEKVGKLVVDSASGKKKFGTLTGHNVSAESFRHQRRLANNENRLISTPGNRCGDGNERSLLADISTTSPIRSPSSTTIQYIDSDGSPITPQPISPPPPLTITTPRQTRLSTSNGNLEDRLRHHLATTSSSDTIINNNNNNNGMENSEWNVRQNIRWYIGL